VLATQTGPITGFTITDDADPDIGRIRLRIKSNGNSIKFNFVDSWWGTQPTKLSAGFHTMTFWKIHGKWYGEYDGMEVPTAGKRPFKITIKLAAQDDTFVLDTAGSVAIQVDWGDGVVEAVTADSPSHTYTGASLGDEFTIMATGVCNHFGTSSNPTVAQKANAAKIIRVDAWGDLGFTSLNGGFAGASNLVYVAPGSASGQGDITGVTDMQGCFAGTTSLKIVPLLDTSAVINFKGCFYLSRVPGEESGIERMPLWDTSSATNMDMFFRYCKHLTYIPPFDTSNVTYMSYMFEKCSNLQNLPMLDTAKVTKMPSFISGCAALTTLPPFDMSKVTSIKNFARECSSLITVHKYDWSSLIDASAAFYKCTALLDFPKIDMPEVTNISDAFLNCTGLHFFPAIRLPKCTHLFRAWSGCSAMETFGLIVLGAATNLSKAWFDCSKLKTFPSINTSTVTDFSNTWSYCSALTTFPSLNMSSATKIGSAWENCSSITAFPHIVFPATIQVTNTAQVSLTAGFGAAWNNCTQLQTFPANCFRNVQTGAFKDTFVGTNLSIQSKANIMQDLDASGVTGATPPDGPYTGTMTASTLTITGGTPIATGDAADVQKQKLAAKGWDVTQVQ
jgi:surface protein